MDYKKFGELLSDWESFNQNELRNVQNGFCLALVGGWLRRLLDKGIKRPGGPNEKSKDRLKHLIDTQDTHRVNQRVYSARTQRINEINRQIFKAEKVASCLIKQGYLDAYLDLSGVLSAVTLSREKQVTLGDYPSLNHPVPAGMYRLFEKDYKLIVHSVWFMSVNSVDDIKKLIESPLSDEKQEQPALYYLSTGNHALGLYFDPGKFRQHLYMFDPNIGEAKVSLKNAAEALFMLAEYQKRLLPEDQRKDAVFMLHGIKPAK
jgi:hypothetical protein